MDMNDIMALAQRALRTGWTPHKARLALLAHVNRERRYLDRRKAQGMATPFDEVTEADQLALAIAICWLVEDTTNQQP
jgi:hypothetical protein